MSRSAQVPELARLAAPHERGTAQSRLRFTARLSQRDRAAARSRHRIGFHLNAGYFRHSRRCFAPETFHENDIADVAGRLGYNGDLFRPDACQEWTRQRHERIIERLVGFRTLKGEGEEHLSQLIDQKVRAHEKPKTIFHASTDHLLTNRIALSGYRCLQELILSAIGRLKTREMAVIEAHLPTKPGHELDLFLGDKQGSKGLRAADWLS